MSHTYYEAHVTMLGAPKDIRPHVDRLGWRFSAIDGDPVLGDGVKCYATKHFNRRIGERVLDELFRVADALSSAGCQVTRRKVELVLFDDRSTKIRCAGACPECHWDDTYPAPGSALGEGYV